MVQLSTLLDLIWEFPLASICQGVVAVELRAKEGGFPFWWGGCVWWDLVVQLVSGLACEFLKPGVFFSLC